MKGHVEVARRWLCGIALVGLLPTSSLAFLPGDRWSSTASGFTGQAGDPITLTWSFVPDGTTIPAESAGSDLISFLDTTFGVGSGGPDLTRRPWFRLFEESFDRWSQLGGITYRYEPRDDGVTHGSFSGSSGRRGDVRIGGTYLDGPSGTLAYNQLPNGGDMVLDTGDGSFFGNSGGDYVRLRNTIMHEHGHGMGINHVESTNSSLLMEPFINASFDGPQLDEVRAIHYFYGDVYEKSNNGLGNNTASRATNLGAIAAGNSASIGTDAAGTTQQVLPTQTDFVSIDRITDVDYYRFTVADSSLLDAQLIPRGGVFAQGPEGGSPSTFDANARADLVLEILDQNGSSVLASSNLTGLGGTEQIADLVLSEGGDYFARITALNDTIQLYELSLSLAAPAITSLAADFNLDGSVDDGDLALWADQFARGPGGDTDRDGDSDGSDLLVWQRQFGQNPSSSVPLAPVPEPDALVLLLFAVGVAAPSRWIGYNERPPVA